ncbi:MAG: hypothetical protein O7E57_04495 [Gammaproteobacteria bacterium]|nr:hypothetical protein [Gammaproteobacteria bacterium]
MLTGFEIKRIELWTLFKLAFFIYAAIGLVVGMIYGFLLLVGGVFGSFLDDEMAGLGFLGGVIGLFLIPFLAVLYGAIGSVFITVLGWVYNVSAGLIGGIRLTVDVDDAQAQAPAETSQPTETAEDPARMVPPGPNPADTESE